MRLGDYIKRKRIDPFEKMSKVILRNIQYKSPCEIDVYKLCDLYGMKVNLSLLPNDVNHATSHKKGRRGVINLCVNKDERAERESLTHEFSHLYLHQMNQTLQETHVIEKMELQAFKLASNLLMPSKDILNFEVFPDLNETYIIAKEMADYFNVTVEFAYQRLKYFNENYKFHKEERFVRLTDEERMYNVLFNYNIYDSTKNQGFKLPQPIDNIKKYSY